MRQELLDEISQAFEKTDQALKMANKLFDEQQALLSVYKSTPEEEKEAKDRLTKYLLKHQSKCEELALKFRKNIGREIDQLENLLTRLINHPDMSIALANNDPHSMLYNSDTPIDRLVSTPAWASIEIDVYFVMVGDYCPNFMPSILFFYVDIEQGTFSANICNPDRLDITYNSKTPYVKLADFPLENYNTEEIHQIIVDYLTKELAFLAVVQCPS